MVVEKQWMLATEAFNAFRDKHPELALTGGHWGFHNMLRQNRARLEKADAIRKANGKHWIAHVDRFHRALFDLLTLPADRQAKTVSSFAVDHQGGSIGSHHGANVIPLWSVAFDFGVSEAVLCAELRNAGVQVLEINVMPTVKDKRWLFVLRHDIDEFLLSRVVSTESMTEERKDQ